jgi:hypothetical protein
MIELKSTLSGAEDEAKSPLDDLDRVEQYFVLALGDAFARPRHGHGRADTDSMVLRAVVL